MYLSIVGITAEHVILYIGRTTSPDHDGKWRCGAFKVSGPLYIPYYGPRIHTTFQALVVEMWYSALSLYLQSI